MTSVCTPSGLLHSRHQALLLRHLLATVLILAVLRFTVEATQLAVAASGAWDGTNVSHYTTGPFPVPAGFRVVGESNLQIYGPYVVMNHKKVETAFMKALNSQLMSGLAVHSVNYSTYPSKTLGLESFASLIVFVQMLENGNSTMTFATYFLNKELAIYLRKSALTVSKVYPRTAVLDNFFVHREVGLGQTIIPPDITDNLNHIEVTGANLLPFHVDKQTLLLASIQNYFEMARIPVATINVSNWVEAEESGNNRRLLQQTKADTILIDIWTTLVPADSFTPPDLWSNDSLRWVWEATKKLDFPMNVTLWNATAYATVFDKSLDPSFNVTEFPGMSATDITAPSRLKRLGLGSTTGTVVAVAAIVPLIFGLAGLLWWLRQRARFSKTISRSKASLPSGWDIDINEIQICTRPDGSLWSLGEGKFGTVYKAKRRGTTEVAVKLLHCRGDDESQRAIQQEIAMLQKACHDGNIVQFYGSCLTDTTAMLCMEYMEGGDLRSAIFKGKQLGTPHFGWYARGADVALAVAQALHFLHTSGVIHHDVKSSNVLLTKGNVAKVSDMGLAKMEAYLSEASTGTDPALAGTFNYAAPELLMGANCSPKVDVFSYGVLLWELVSNEPPQRGRMRDLRVPEECPLKVDTLIRVCTDPDPEKRPSMGEVVAWLRSIEDSKTVLA